MSDTPDFEALRAKRNAAVLEHHRRLAEEYGIPLQSLLSNFNPAACYCACASGGPCEHKWDGEPWESEDGCAWSTTCSRCGCTSVSHDMRNLP
jgi:hypothetical protein